MKYGASMTHLLVCVLCFLGCVVKLSAVQYGDYSIGHMPQYNDQHEDGDVGQVRSGHDEYSERSQDVPVHLDYKYEEEPQGKLDDLPIKDIVDERVWDNTIKKKRKPLVLRSGRNRDLDKYSLDETEPKVKTDKSFAMHGSEFRIRNYGKRSESQKNLKHITIGQNDDIDNVENNNDYVHKEELEGGDSDDAIEVGHFRYRSTTQRKPRRKPRDRALHSRGWRENTNNVKLEQEEVDPRSDREHDDIKNPRFSGIIEQESMNKKNIKKYDYEEYYDMKRVQHMKNRLPALLKQSTVRTMEEERTSYSGHWLNRRAVLTSTYSVGKPIVVAVTSTVTNLTTTTTRTTSHITSMARNSSDLSLAEKSRLSILKKAQRKESSRNMSSSTKPPVLLQVTRKMQTVVMVEPRPAESALRARDILEDSPERLRRARQLVRHKLVAGARSIHELIDNWDEMICDYIDVSLLDTDTASYLETNGYVTLLLFSMSLFLIN